MEVTTEELLEELGEEFAADLAKISMEEAVRSYRRCERRDGEGFMLSHQSEEDWKRRFGKG